MKPPQLKIRKKVRYCQFCRKPLKDGRFYYHSRCFAMYDIQYYDIYQDYGVPANVTKM